MTISTAVPSEAARRRSVGEVVPRQQPAVHVRRVQDGDAGVLGSRGADEGERLAAIEAARLDEGPGDQLRVGQRMAIADDAGVETLPGVGPKTSDALKEAGYATVGDLRKASPEQLSEIKGIGIFFHAAEIDEQTMKDQWDKIVALIPDRGAPAAPSNTPMAASFRVRYSK